MIENVIVVVSIVAILKLSVYTSTESPYQHIVTVLSQYLGGLNSNIIAIITIITIARVFS